MHCRFVLFACSLIAFLSAVDSLAVGSQRGPAKLIEFGWDEPDTSFLRAHIAEMRQTPFRGCVFHAHFSDAAIVIDDAAWAAGGSGNFTWLAWGQRAFQASELQRAILDLQATDFGTFDHNFLRLNVTPGNVDWFDDFASIVNNCKLAAHVAREGKCKGILLDIEQYESPLFNYGKQRDAGTKTWDQYAAQVRRRGAEVMSAFQESFPELSVFLTFGYCLPWSESEAGKRPLADCEYGLLAPFLDGMLDVANGKSKLVDGHELSYNYRDPEQFPAAYDRTKKELLQIVGNVAKYREVFSTSFGIWIDYNWRANGWNTSDLSANYFTPDVFGTVARKALRSADEYVWIYSETPRWWSANGTSIDLPAAYINALRRAAAPDPPSYLPAKAYHVLPETHNNQSGYFSLCEGLDGSIYVGTAKYGENAYLVEFDPLRETQRVVIDTNKLCGLDARGYAAQAKIHTRNFVGPSGKIYVGSKQGYRLDPNDSSEYPGGYVMAYDPRTGRAENLGMPFPGQGIADVAADEGRGVLYVVTCEDQHWMRGELPGGAYRELGPLLTPYAMTLIGADGRAHAITKDFQLASYNPDNGAINIRPIEVNGVHWSRPNDAAIPTWVLSADRRRAFLLLMNDPTLIEIELEGDAPTARATSHGKMIEGKDPDSRCGLDLGPDGNVYAVVRVNNETGFGGGYLHHVLCFLPANGTMEDCGVIAVSNPDYFDWNAVGADGKPLPWTHGFHRLPDGTLTPMYSHMSLRVAADNSIYITIIYPFTLLRIDRFRKQASNGAVEQMSQWASELTDRIDGKITEFSRVADTIADRHMRGGMIGFPFEWQALPQDLWGRSGGMMHIGFTRGWKPERSDSEKANDVAIVGYDAPPGAGDLDALRKLKERGVYLVGIGPRQMSGLQDIVATCDVWFDSGLGDDDRVVSLDAGGRAGHANVIANAILGGTLVAETVGALTRRGKMPTMWKGFAHVDGHAWADKYFGKFQFHEDIQVPPLAEGELGRRFLRQIRYPIARLRSQAQSLREAAALIKEETAAQRKTYVVWQGHMPPTYVGKREDAAWAVPVELHPSLESQVANYRQAVPDGALVLNLGHHGLDPIEAAVRVEKKHRVIHMAGDHPDPRWRPGPEQRLRIDLGYAFGDACVHVDGYPLLLFAPSGIAQAIAYESINAELAR